jgi:hypothetical protein
MTMAIGDTVAGATEGSVLFVGPSGVLAQNNSNEEDAKGVVFRSACLRYLGLLATGWPEFTCSCRLRLEFSCYP